MFGTPIQRFPKVLGDLSSPRIGVSGIMVKLVPFVPLLTSRNLTHNYLIYRKSTVDDGPLLPKSGPISSGVSIKSRPLLRIWDSVKSFRGVLVLFVIQCENIYFNE